MGFRRHCFHALTSLLLASNLFAQTDANRLTYLSDFCDPYYPTLSFAKLTTPQWVGDTRVQAVVTLGIDDMREIGRYETYLLIGILIHRGHFFWPYFERLSNIQPQFSPTDLARDARANPFVVAGFKWPTILHGFG